MRRLKLWDEFEHLTNACERLACEKKKRKNQKRGVVSGDIYVYL